MFVIVVAPCLNEEANVATLCRSLGFGSRAAREVVGSALILVDNGSNDRTIEVMQEVAQGAPDGIVHIVHEETRGYVPARHRGAIEARKIALARGIPENNVLLVQADADTLYDNGYLEAMAKAALVAGPNVLVEGYSEAPRTTVDNAAYSALERDIDAAAAPVLVDGDRDVIVDDKVAAFRISDYFAWGGHVREYSNDGDEVLAETTRLFMRATLHGAKRVHADGAFARTSIRRTIENPGLALATAGFPRGPKWRDEWARRYNGPQTIEDFTTFLSSVDRTLLIRTRLSHLVGMFFLLPGWTGSAVHFTRERGSSARSLKKQSTVHAMFADGVPRPAEAIVWALSRPWSEVSAVLKSAGCGPAVVRLLSGVISD